MTIILRHIVRVILLLYFLLPVDVQAENILAFGDSITLGYPYVAAPANGARIGGYPPALEELFPDIGKKVSVYNWGVGGETTNSGLSRINGLCHTDADYTLILEGTNDFFSGISPQTTAANVVQMAKNSRACGKTPMVGTLTPDFRGSGKSVEKINSYLASAVQNAGIELVDLYDTMVGNWNDYVSSDRLHPNPYGYQQIARIWFHSFLEIQMITGLAESRQDSPKTVLTFLNGTITATGNVRGINFEYGRTTALGSSITASPSNGISDGGLVVKAELREMPFDTTYYYRIVTDYGGKTFYGETESFRTPRRIIVNTPWLHLLLAE